MSGRAAPVTAAAGSTTPAGTPAGTPVGTPSRPAPVATPSGTPTAPEAYASYRLEQLGLAVELPVPTDWSLKRTADGVDFGDPSGRVLLRVTVVTSTKKTATECWDAAEPGFRRTLPDYRRLGLAEVPAVGDSAADLTFTFVRDGVTRRVIDRGIVVGDRLLAVYYSAPQEWYDRLAPVFDRASRDLRLP